MSNQTGQFSANDIAVNHTQGTQSGRFSPSDLAENETFLDKVRENPVNKALYYGVRNPVETLASGLVRGIEENPITAGAGLAASMTGLGAIPTALSLGLAQIGDKTLSRDVVQKYTDDDKANDIQDPQFTGRDALDTLLSAGMGYVMPGSGGVNIPGITKAPAPALLPTVEVPLTRGGPLIRGVEGGENRVPYTPAPPKQSPATFVKPYQPPTKSGSGYPDAVRQGAAEAAPDTFVTPYQLGARGSKLAEEEVASYERGANSFQELAEKQREGFNEMRDRTFGMSSPGEVGAKIKSRYQEEVQREKAVFDDLFNLVDGNARKNDRNIVLANTKIQKTMDDVLKTFDIQPEHLAESRVLELSSEVVHDLKTAMEIGDPGSGSVLHWDYSTINHYRQTLGEHLSVALEKGKEKDAKLLKQLRDGITEAQAIFLTPKRRAQWEKIKADYAAFQNARKALSPVLAPDTPDHYVKNLFDSNGMNRLAALQSFAPEAVEAARKNYLQQMVDNTETVRLFDKQMKKLGTVQNAYFNDVLTSRARNLVAFNQGIKSIESFGDKASRTAILGKLSHIGHTITGGIGGGLLGLSTHGGEGGLLGATAGWALAKTAYMIEGRVAYPMYKASVELARNAKDPAVREAAKQIVSQYAKQTASGAGRQAMTDQVKRLYTPDPNYTPEQE